MEIRLPADLERLVEERVKSGRYGSAGDVVREALLLLEHLEESPEPAHEEVRDRIEAGWLAAQRGELVDGDQVFDRIDKELAEAESTPSE